MKSNKLREGTFMDKGRDLFFECFIYIVGYAFFAITLCIAQKIYPTAVQIGEWLDVCAIITLIRFIAYYIRYISFKVFIMGIMKPFRNDCSMILGILLMLLSDFIAVNILSGQGFSFEISFIWLKAVLAFIFTVIEALSMMSLAFHYASTPEDMQY